MRIASDQHIHSRFSTDSSAEPRAMAEAALSRGLSDICFTDHYDIDSPFAGKFRFDINEYVASLRELAEEYRGRLRVGIGIELGLMPGKEEKAENIAAAAPFDIVIGSVHYIDNKDPYYREEFSAYTDAALYHCYFEEILASIRNTSCYHALGHLDYIVRYGWKKDEEYSYEKNAEIIDEILRLIIDRDIALEVNSCGYRSGLDFPNPHPKILRRYRALGGERITLGSDAHRPSDVAADFEEMRQVLLAAGYSFYERFSGGEGTRVPLV